ncbi:insulinase family protein, partial [bacterium]|nr:insulinase family protein [candidate division CSSED10-310 bacterium]
MIRLVRKHWIVVVVAGCLLLGGVPGGQAAETRDMFKTCLEDQVQEFTLANGMKFILIERPQIPVFSAIVLVGAGSVDEPPGKTGVAHVFEHMAFKGTTTVGTRDYAAELPILDRIEDIGARLTALRAESGADPEAITGLENELKEAQDAQNAILIDNELEEMYNRNGAHFLNAGTSRDFTIYMVSLPANRLELWACMETERLYRPVFRQFYQERDVIMEERRMGTDNSAEGEFYEEFIATAYRVHPYGDPVIGWMRDIQNLTIADARQFHETYYVPSNITVAVAGDIRLEELKAVAEKTFAQLPDRPAPPDRIPVEPAQNYIRTVRVQRDDGMPEIIIGWHMPRYPDPEAVALDITAKVLGDGHTSRLYSRLVEKGLAIDVSVTAETLQRYDGLFTVNVTPKRGVSEREIIDAVLEEIALLKTRPPTEYEINRIKKQHLVGFVRQLEANMWLAMQLAYFQEMFGD